MKFVNTRNLAKEIEMRNKARVEAQKQGEAQAPAEEKEEKKNGSN